MMESRKLGDICEVVSGGTPLKSKSEFWNGDIPWIKIGNIKGKFVSEADEFITEKGLAGSSAKMLLKGKILYTIFATLGEVGVLTIDACTNQAIAGITIKNKDIVDSDYLYYYLKSKKNYVKYIGRGVAQNNINMSILREFEVPIREKFEQQFIANVLDRVERIIKTRKEEIKDLDDLIKARFVEMFGDLKINNKRWPVVNFTECAKIDTNMIYNFDGFEKYPHIGIDSIEKETGYLNGYRTVEEDGIKSGKYLFTAKHIIYSKIRPNLNKVAMPDFDGVCSADAYPILVNSDLCEKEYLAYTLRSEYFLDYILALSNRTNLPKVNKNQVEGFCLPLPPIKVQRLFTSFFRQVNKSKVAVQKALDETQTLFDSLMQEYFG